MCRGRGSASVRRSRKLELSVPTRCSNDVGDRTPPILDRPRGTPASPKLAGVPFWVQNGSFGHREPSPGTSLPITTTISIGIAPKGIEPNQPGARFHKERRAGRKW
jgi:hypothetical protein